MCASSFYGRDTFLRLMGRDKKVDETGLRFVLVNGGIGAAVLSSASLSRSWRNSSG